MGLPKVFPFLSLSHFTWPGLKQGGVIFKVLRAGEVLPNFLNNISAFCGGPYFSAARVQGERIRLPGSSSFILCFFVEIFAVKIWLYTTCAKQ